MYIPRVQRNLQTLGILWCVLGVYRVVAGLFGIIFLRAFTTHNFGDDAWMFGGRWHGPFPPMWVANFWPIIAVVTHSWGGTCADHRLWPAESQTLG
jgi:hypothetical protein